MTDLTPGPEMDRAVAEAVGLVVQAADRRWSDDTCRAILAWAEAKEQNGDV